MSSEVTAEITPEVDDYIELWGDRDLIGWAKKPDRESFQRILLRIIEVTETGAVILDLEGTVYKDRSWSRRVDGRSTYQLSLSVLKEGAKLVPASQRECKHCSKGSP